MNGNKPTLSICFPTYRDFDGLYFSALDLPLTHPEVCDQIEVIVVDNEPRRADPKQPERKTALENWVGGHLAGSVRARYVHAPDPVGPANAKQRCIDEATGRFVLVADSHVRISSGGLARLLAFYAANPDTSDLYSGPMFYDSAAITASRGEPLKGFATHLEEVWRGEMLGTWATDPRGAERDAEPFDVPAMGCGLFTCRREAFVGFNPDFRGFGGEECYIHHKTRQAGHRCVCLPFLRWVHRFGRPGGVPYPALVWAKVRNYVIGHQELGLPMDGIHQHFVVDQKKLTEADWKHLLEDPINHVRSPHAKNGCGSCGSKQAMPETITLDDLYKKASETPSDINQHCPKLRELAAECKTVVEFGHRRGVSTVGLLAGQPSRLVSFDLNEDPVWRDLKKREGQTDFTFVRADVTRVEIPECDLLFEDSRHTADHIATILERHAQRVRRWIAFHDTQIFGERGEDGGPGILPAIRRFMQLHPEWSVVYHNTENHGFTVLGKLPEDKPKLPSLPRMGVNLAKAVAKHLATGAKYASEEMVARRLDTCDLCDQLRLRVEAGESADDVRADPTRRRCAACGCFLVKRPDGGDGKALWADSLCSLGRWPVESETDKP